MATRIALSLVSFLAGAVLVATMGFARGNEAPAAPSPSLLPCVSETERAYEIMRFASYSHTYWLDYFAETGESADPYGMDKPWHQWWADHYSEVLTAIEATCVIADQHEPLDSLPGTWVEYPERGIE